MYKNTILADDSLNYLHKLFNHDYAAQTLVPFVIEAGLALPHDVLSVKQVKTVKHNPGRRCVIEFVVDIISGEGTKTIGVMGKSKKRGVSSKIISMQSRLSGHGFSLESPDGISVPRYMGWDKSHNIWFYEKALGDTLSDLIRENPLTLAVSDVADIAFKVHQCGYPTWRAQTLHDELEILKKGFYDLSNQIPGWEQRLSDLYALCLAVAKKMPPHATVGLHRDFYADQVVKGDRYYVIDMDCYAEGDPCLDIGNFNAHLKEQALRELGDPDGLRHYEQQVTDRYMKLSGLDSTYNITAYTWLSLARHVYLCRRIPDRHDSMQRIYHYCKNGLQHILREAIVL